MKIFDVACIILQPKIWLCKNIKFRKTIDVLIQTDKWYNINT